MDANEAFGPWVKHRRRSLALTQDELAQRVVYPIVTIRKVESGDQRASVALTKALEIPPDQRAAFLRFARNKPAAQEPDVLAPKSFRRALKPCWPLPRWMTFQTYTIGASPAPPGG